MPQRVRAHMSFMWKEWGISAATIAGLLFFLPIVIEREWIEALESWEVLAIVTAFYGGLTVICIYMVYKMFPDEERAII